MIPDQELTQGDLLPAFQKQLINKDRSIPVLPPGTTVVCRVIFQTCGHKVSETTATFVDQAGAYVSHDWIEQETRVPGTLLLYFVVTVPSKQPVAYPWWGYYRVEVSPALA